MWQSESTPSPEAPAPLDDAELAASLKASIRNHLLFTLAHDPTTARRAHWWTATCMAVRDRALAISFKTMAAHRSKNTRRVNYLSLEYLMGRLLENNLRNTGLYDAAKSALGELGQDLETIINEEADMGLGNGGLGRLAACFLDSLSTLDLPAVGYGIHYEFGLFRQEFVNGRQVEQPDPWIRDGNPWNIVRPEYKVEVNLYGRAIQHFDDRGNSVYTWENTKKLVGLPWDIPIIGFDSKTVNFLRLWESRATDEFNLRVFNEGPTSRPFMTRRRARRSPRSSTPMTRPRAARNCVSCSSTSLSPARSATSSAATSGTTRAGMLPGEGGDPAQ